VNENELLLWLSARKEGSWPQFRGAVASLAKSGDGQSLSAGLPIHQLLRFNLQRLGHVEFFTVNQTLRWRIAPPVLALARSGDLWIGTATGARYGDLAKRLESTNLAFMATSMPDAPDAWQLSAATSDSLERAAKAAGMLIQNNAPAAILECVPPVDARHLRAAWSFPLGSRWRVDRFDAADLAWTESSREEAAIANEQELFRFKSEYEKHYLLCSQGSCCRVPPQVGKYLALRQHRTKVLRYDSTELRFSTPAVCRPPMLVERALMLCSGRLPAYDATEGRARVHYSQVPLSVAVSAASLLRQELRA